MKLLKMVWNISLMVGEYYTDRETKYLLEAPLRPKVKTGYIMHPWTSVEYFRLAIDISCLGVDYSTDMILKK